MASSSAALGLVWILHEVSHALSCSQSGVLVKELCRTTDGKEERPEIQLEWNHFSWLWREVCSQEMQFLSQMAQLCNLGLRSLAWNPPEPTPALAFILKALPLLPETITIFQHWKGHYIPSLLSSQSTDR